MEPVSEWSCWRTDVYRNLTSLWIKPRERAFKQFKSPILNLLSRIYLTIKKLRVLHGRKKFHFNMKWGKFLFRPIKWRSVKQVEHVTRMGDVIFLAKFQPEKHEYGWDSNNKKEGYKNSIWRHVLDSSGTGLGQVTDRCERDNSPSRYARLRTSWLLGELWNISVSSYLGRQKRN